jgi:hypothetical protein
MLGGSLNLICDTSVKPSLALGLMAFFTQSPAATFHALATVEAVPSSLRHADTA